MPKKKKSESTVINDIEMDFDSDKDFGDSIVGNLTLFDKESILYNSNRLSIE